MGRNKFISTLHWGGGGIFWTNKNKSLASGKYMFNLVKDSLIGIKDMIYFIFDLLLLLLLFSRHILLHHPPFPTNKTIYWPMPNLIIKNIDSFAHVKCSFTFKAKQWLRNKWIILLSVTKWMAHAIRIWYRQGLDLVNSIK